MTLVVVTGAAAWTVLLTWTVKNVSVKVSCAGSNTLKVFISTSVQTGSVNLFKVCFAGNIVRVAFIILTSAEG